MAGYSRPLSRSELRQIKKKKLSTFGWCAAGVVIAMAAIAGLLYALYVHNPY